MIKIAYRFLIKNKFLLLVLVLGFVFRVYHYAENMSFAHDQDLYSWIARDILVNHHPRLVGQITSVDGVFIGPLYYYFVALCYLVGKMNPLSVMYPLAFLGIFTVWSFYYVIGKKFSRRAGLIAAFLYAISYGAAMYDRWSVPTQPAILWSLWFLYVILEMLDGKVRSIPLYGLLVGLFWHIHIAFIPIVPLPFLAYFFSKGTFKEKISQLRTKEIIVALFTFLVLSSPVWLFELKHNFSQVRSIITATQLKSKDASSLNRFYKVLEASATEMQVKFFPSWAGRHTSVVWGVFLITVIVLLKRRIINFRQMIFIFSWIFLIFAAQWTSKKNVSEYYFTNIFPIYLLFISLTLDQLFSTKHLRLLILLLAVPYFALNFNLLTHDVWDISYLHRKDIIDYIKKDATKKGYPCVSINYIADFGTGVGFRYISWYQGLRVIKHVEGIPSYDIVIPWQTSASSLDSKFGRFGLIVPSPEFKFTNAAICENKANELDPMLGYVE